MKTTNYQSMKEDADKRNVTTWSADSPVYKQRYNKLSDNSVSQRKIRNVLHLKDQEKTSKIGTEKSQELYKKQFQSSEGLIVGTGEGKTQNVKVMNDLNRSFEKLSTRRENELNSSVLCRGNSEKPKWK